MTKTKAKKIDLVLGSGGVGKTTVAAALGLAYSQKEKGALFTVDPSLRLCQTLGLEKLSLTPATLQEGRLEAYGLEIQDGLKLLLDRVIGDPARVKSITEHRLYNIIEGNISHLDHFLAIDKIVELMDRPDLEFLVIDTPPHDQAFEFFESPRVLANFLDRSFLKALLEGKMPSDGLFSKVFGRALEEGWKLFRSLLGENFWQELAGLLQDLMPLRERLLYASEKLDEMLQQKSTHVLLVTIPERLPFLVAQELGKAWNSKLDLKVETLILNRAIPSTVKLPDNLQGSLFFNKWKIQEQLCSESWFKSFKKVMRIAPLSPSSMERDNLKDIGHELIS